LIFFGKRDAFSLSLEDLLVNSGGMKYIMKCNVCAKEFEVPTFTSVIPAHPGETEAEGGDSSCPGSKIMGILLGPSSDSTTSTSFPTV